MPSRGNYWQKGGLPDETVKEEDLSQALQAKVNSGGGGGFDPVTRALMYDELTYQDPSAFWDDSLFQSEGTGFIDSDGRPHGIVKATTGATLGNGFGFNNGENGSIDPQVNTEAKFRLAGVDQGVTQIIIITGFGDDFPNESQTIATCEENINTGAWFRLSANDSANWQAVTKEGTGGNSTVIDTGVTATTSPTDFEITLDGTTATFFINGSQVAQTTLTYPDSECPLILHVNNQVASNKVAGLDYWHILTDRA